MFSGIVETTSAVISVRQRRVVTTIQIQRPKFFNDIKLGDSIAVNGVCLTIADLNDIWIQFDLIPETLQRSNLCNLFPGKLLNLERSLQFSARISGHCVQGHVDTMAKIINIESFDETKLLTFSIQPAYKQYLVEKGYIALDGMSLTLTLVLHDIFQIAFIPHTLQQTIAQYYQVGDLVNIETDILGKYIINYLHRAYGGSHG